MRRYFGRSLTIASLVVTVAAVQAAVYPVSLTSVGNGVGNLAGNFAWTNSFFIYGLGAGPLNDFVSFSSVAGVGSGQFAHSSNGNSFTFNSFYLPANVVQVGNSYSVAGTWTYTGGTGAYAGLSGGGTFTINWLNLGQPGTVQGDGPGTVAFTGTLVPEPGTLAAIGLGAVALLGRRRRK